MESSLIVYSGENCAACVMTKKYLAMKNVNYKEINVDDPTSGTTRTDLQKLSGRTTVPVITAGNDIVVGFNAGGLAKLIEGMK